MLAHRPLLTPSADDLRAIRAALAEHQPRVAVAAEAVLRGTRAALDPGSELGAGAAADEARATTETLSEVAYCSSEARSSPITTCV
jgi:hypothetical protein